MLGTAGGPGAEAGVASARAGPRLGSAGRQRVELLDRPRGATLSDQVAPSDVPDILAPGLRAVFCGINPGRVSAAAHAHFANPRNDFWRLLHEAGFTPRRLDPAEQERLLDSGYGLTNAAYRTTKGSGDLRKADFAGSRERLERIAIELRPRALAFVGKEAYRGVFGERPELGRQPGLLEDTILFVLPSTSPANAVVPYGERLRWFLALDDALSEPERRRVVRALVLDDRDRTLLVRYVSPMGGGLWWVLPGGGLHEGETLEKGFRRELREEAGLHAEPGPCIWTREFVFPYGTRWYRQQERIHLVRVGRPRIEPELSPAELRREGVHEHRWWTLGELEASEERFAPRRLARFVRELLEVGPPPTPLDVGP